MTCDIVLITSLRFSIKTEWRVLYDLRCTKGTFGITSVLDRIRTDAFARYVSVQEGGRQSWTLTVRSLSFLHESAVSGRRSQAVIIKIIIIIIIIIIVIIMCSFLCHFSFGTQGPLHETELVGGKQKTTTTKNLSHFAIDH